MEMIIPRNGMQSRARRRIFSWCSSHRSKIIWCEAAIYMKTWARMILAEVNMTPYWSWSWEERDKLEIFVFWFHHFILLSFFSPIESFCATNGNIAALLKWKKKIMSKSSCNFLSVSNCEMWVIFVLSVSSPYSVFKVNDSAEDVLSFTFSSKIASFLLTVQSSRNRVLHNPIHATMRKNQPLPSRTNEEVIPADPAKNTLPTGGSFTAYYRLTVTYNM